MGAAKRASQNPGITLNETGVEPIALQQTVKQLNTCSSKDLLSIATTGKPLEKCGTFLAMYATIKHIPLSFHDHSLPIDSQPSCSPTSRLFTHPAATQIPARHAGIYTAGPQGTPSNEVSLRIRRTASGRRGRRIDSFCLGPSEPSQRPRRLRPLETVPAARVRRGRVSPLEICRDFWVSGFEVRVLRNRYM